MLVKLSQCYQVPNTVTLWSTAGQFHSEKEKKCCFSAAMIHSQGEKVWESAARRQSHRTRLTRSRKWRSSKDRAGFSCLTLTVPQTVWVKVRGHCHCVPSSANSSLVNRQSHHRQHSWDWGRVGTCSTPRLFRGLFRDCSMLFSLCFMFN